MRHVPTSPTRASLSLRLRIVCGDLYAMGPGKADLLEQVDACRSIAGAGRALGYSYSKTRQLIDEMNACFRSQVVATMKGGRERGGASLTDAGREALTRFRALEAKAMAAIQEECEAYGRILKDRPGPPTAPD